ncbi:MAG: sigma-70 family RNA polymerase sigma factor [Prevotella sp.]|nr:sigma-70 family RNA polymerase sigma factor [Prevotella sp.]
MNTKGKNDRLMAMEHLYKEFYHPLFLFALTYLDSEDEARDVVSGVFEIVWQRWQKEPVTAKVTSSYLYTLTKNRCIDSLRRHKAHRNYTELMSRAEQFDTSADVNEYEQSVSRLREVVDSLPEPGRTILEHCYFKHMSYQETADHLSLSLVVVRKNMLKVFNILRKTLKNTNDLV